MSQLSLRDFLSLHHIRAGRVLVGVSGGADSVALLRELVDLQPELALEIHVAHFDHAVRLESSADADWVQNLCQMLHVECIRERAIATEESPPCSEESFRDQRYEFLTRTAIIHDCRWVALAHTADDQAETILHRLLRGTGLSGLAGMPTTRELAPGVQLVRPLLMTSRAQVLQSLQARGQSYRTDSSNASVQFMRNRLRLEVLPAIRESVNPRVDEALLRLARQAAAVSEFVERQAEELLQQSLLDGQPHIVRLNCEPLADVDAAVLQSLVPLVWSRQNWPRKSLSCVQIERLAALIRETGGAISLPEHVQAIKRGAILELRRTVPAG